MSSDDSKRPTAAARLRAAILDPSAHCGPREPVAPIDRAERIRGGEFMCWDARVDAQVILRGLLGFELPDDLRRQILAAADGPTIAKLRRVRQALSRREVPQVAERRCQEAAALLAFNIAALGCATASAECAALAFDSAVTWLGSADSVDSYAQGFLAFRAASLWASDAQVDATELEYKANPLYTRLSGFDQRARYWLASFAVIAKAEDMIANEDDILRGAQACSPIFRRSPISICHRFRRTGTSLVPWRRRRSSSSPRSSTCPGQARLRLTEGTARAPSVSRGLSGRCR